MNPWETDSTFLKRWMDGELSEEERHAFEESKEGQQFADLLIAAKGLKLPDFETEQELGRLKTSLQHETKDKQVWLWPAMKYAVAALIILAIPLVFIFYASDTVVKTSYGESSSIELPDGSTVVLHAYSKLTYDEDDWKQKRIINLEGQAFFQVAPGKPFIVNAKQGSVEVLGTQFDIWSRDQETLRVACYQGIVSVSNGLASVVLNTGEGVNLTGDQVTRFEPSGSAPTWLNGISSFQNVPLKLAVNELEILFDLTVANKASLPDVSFTGSIPHNDAESAVELVLGPFDVDYEFVEADKQLIIK